MSSAPLKKKNISNQVLFMYENSSTPCHIRDVDGRYIYTNSAMDELLNLPESFSIEGKIISDIPLLADDLWDELGKYEKNTINTGESKSILFTSKFGKNSKLQIYIFDITPFRIDRLEIVGVITEARPCHFFSPLKYLAGKKTLVQP